MAVVAIKLKVMPSSPSVDLEEIEEKLKEKLESMNAKNITFEQEPIAFGLKAIIATFAWPEEQDTSVLENPEELGIENVNSMQVIDYRRAIG